MSALHGMARVSTSIGLTLAAAVLGCVLAGAARAAQPKEPAGSADHPLVGRYQGAVIVNFAKKDFDEVRLLKSPLDLRMKSELALTNANSLLLQGRSSRIVYELPPERSGLEVMANHAQALKAKGFELLFECANASCLGGETSFYRLGGLLDGAMSNAAYGKGVRYVLARLARPQGDVIASVLVGESTKTRALVHVVELKGMDSGQIAFVDAQQMQQALEAQGKVALYGIFFNTGKADIKPESQPTLVEIAKFLASNSATQLLVVGHTDNQGAFDMNLDLSRRRAAAVVAMLTGPMGISSARLMPFGGGMVAPVASNAIDAGRAKNRRVELVLR